MLAVFGPTAVAPARFTRFIFNRIILEGAAVRAAAVQALGEFAGSVESVKASAVELLRGCLTDENDEVRDRAITALTALQGDAAQQDALLFRKLPLTPTQLRLSLQTYKMRPTEGPFDYAHLPVVAEPVKKEEKQAETSVKNAEPASPRPNRLYEIPEFADYGAILRSSPATELTEEETEYAVSVIRHVFASHVVLEFLVKNTIEGQVMTTVTMRLSLKEGDVDQWKPVLQLPAPVILCGEEKSCYVALEFAADEIPEATFSAKLVFEAKDAEEDELDELDTIEGYNEEYSVEDFSIQLGDYMSRPVLSDFRASWNELSAENEAVEKMTLPFEDLTTAVQKIIEALGLHAFEGTDRVPIGVGIEEEGET